MVEFANSIMKPTIMLHFINILYILKSDYTICYFVQSMIYLLCPAILLTYLTVASWDDK